nr:hypothetical protein [Tanacetum cinerariifolium]
PEGKETSRSDPRESSEGMKSESSIMEADIDLEEEIRLVENLLYDNSSPRPPKELNDDLSFPRPPPEPPNVEFFFDFELDSGELISVVMNNIDELNEDDCFDPGGGVKTPFLTLASPLRASGISSGWNFHVL